MSSIDKNGDIFRYPTSYSLEYRFDNIFLDLKNVYEFMRAIFDLNTKKIMAALDSVLKEAGRIECIGGKPYGHWEIID